MIQGYRIATGQSRDSMAVFITRSVTMIIVVAFAQGSAMYGSDLINMVEGLQNTVSQYVTGSNYNSPENMIDSALLAMNALQETLSVYSQEQGGNGMGNALTFITGMGQAMPALVSGGLLLLNSIALNLCFVFAPIFILCYLFDQTRPFFTTWVKFTVSTLFSMAVITVVVIIAMKAILLVSATLLAADLASGGTLQIRDIATVQGGLGMMMTTLILGTPPLVTNFFSGAVGASFSAYNNVGNMAGKSQAGGPQDMVARGVGGNTEKTPDASVPNQPLHGLTDKLQSQSSSSNSSSIKGPNDNRGIASNKTAELDVQRAAAHTPALSTTGYLPVSGGLGNANAASGSTNAQIANTNSNNNSPSQSFAEKSVSTPKDNNVPDSAGHSGEDKTKIMNEKLTDNAVRLSRTGIGDDSAAINAKYGPGKRGAANNQE